jgi:hypothetical protein
MNVASCLVWNNTDNEKETTKTNHKTGNTVPPITLKSRHSFHDMPTIHQQNPYKTQSMPMFKSMDQLRSGATTSREHYNIKVTPSDRPITSFEQTHANSVDCLISKYM